MNYNVFNEKNKKFVTKYKKTGGITLVALVVTIIVLLILAGIAISMLSGENGILKWAIKSRTNMVYKSIEEEMSLAVNSLYIKKVSENLRFRELGVILCNELSDNKYTFSLDEDNGKIYIKCIDANISKEKSVAKNDGVLYGIVTIWKDNVEFEFDTVLENANGLNISQLPYFSKDKILKMLSAQKASLIGVNIGDYVDYPVEYSNVNTNNSNNGQMASDEYIGWRVLSIEEIGTDNEYVKLVSAGVPLRYYHKQEEAVEDESALTTNFWTTEFQENGFIGTWESDLFANKYTATNEEGNTKVQAMTKSELDKIYIAAGLGSVAQNGSSVVISDTSSQYYNLLAIPSKTTGYVGYWLATANGSWCMWNVGGWYGDVDTSKGKLYWGYGYNYTTGVRPVVCLKTSVEFYKEKDETTVWSMYNELK